MSPFLAKFEERKQEMNVYFQFAQATEIEIIEPFKDKDDNTYQNYKGYLKVVDAADLSGNLDAKKMRELAEKYAFSVPERCDELLKIKQIRNQLAHGEMLFSEAGAISMTELMDIKQKVFDYLETILGNIHEFIAQDGFKIAVQD